MEVDHDGLFADTIRPVPGRRGATVSDFADLTPGAKPPKHLSVPKHRKGGRNNQGKITARHRGGGHKRTYRLIDFRRNKDGIVARVDSIQYDPNRTARIALLHYVDGEKRYILAPEGLKAGDQVQSGETAPAAVGNCLPLAKIPLGMDVHNIEMLPGRGGVLCRSAGARATLAARDADWAQLNLPSGEIRRVPAACRATIGTLGNADHMGIVLGKAGRKRWMGRRPARPRHRHEPHRPSPRRRRRPHQGRPPSGQPHGQVGQGRLYAETKKTVLQGHRAATPLATLRPVEDQVTGATWVDR